MKLMHCIQTAPTEQMSSRQDSSARTSQVDWPMGRGALTPALRRRVAPK